MSLPQCPICLSDVSSEHVFRLECRHFFHKGCLKNWAQYRLSNFMDFTCPVCRTPASHGSCTALSPELCTRINSDTLFFRDDHEYNQHRRPCSFLTYLKKLFVDRFRESGFLYEYLLNAINLFACLILYVPHNEIDWPVDGACLILSAIYASVFKATPYFYLTLASTCIVEHSHAVRSLCHLAAASRHPMIMILKPSGTVGEIVKRSIQLFRAGAEIGSCSAFITIITKYLCPSKDSSLFALDRDRLVFVDDSAQQRHDHYMTGESTIGVTYFIRKTIKTLLVLCSFRLSLHVFRSIGTISR